MGLMKKKSAKSRSTRATASAAKATSISVVDALELGRTLVENLQLPDSNDTLGKWMAHYLAEQMIAVKKLRDPGAKKAAERQIADVIIKLWLHRESFRNRINPLFNLAPILNVIQTLKPDNDSFIPRAFKPGAGELYAAFRNLMIAAIYAQAKTDGAPALVRAKKTASRQSREEQSVIAGLELWTKEISPAPRFRIIFDDDHLKPVKETRSIKQIALDRISEARQALDAYETELKKQPAAESKKLKRSARNNARKRTA